MSRMRLPMPSTTNSSPQQQAVWRRSETQQPPGSDPSDTRRTGPHHPTRGQQHISCHGPILQISGPLDVGRRQQHHGHHPEHPQSLHTMGATLPAAHSTGGITTDHGAVLQSHHPGSPAVWGRNLDTYPTPPAPPRQLPPPLRMIPFTPDQYAAARRDLEYPTFSHSPGKRRTPPHLSLCPVTSGHYFTIHTDPGNLMGNADSPE